MCWKARIIHPLIAIVLLNLVACDFDIPEKFEMPTWYLDLKIPLVQTRYELGDISNPDAGIFPMADSLGFQIIQADTIPTTELPALPSIPIGLNENISPGPIDGISIDVELPAIEIEQTIAVVAYDARIYQDTAKWCDTFTFGVDPFTFDTLICITDTTSGIPEILQGITGDTLGRLFSFPTKAKDLVTDSVRHMKASNYNQYIVDFFNGIMEDSLSAILITTSEIPIPVVDDPIIASIDTLIIASSLDGSVYTTSFKNNGIPTELENVYSYIVAGSENSVFEPLTDTLASHNSKPNLPSDSSYVETTDLSGKGLTKFLKMATNFSLAAAHPDSIIRIEPGELNVEFGLTFKMAGIDSIDVTTNQYSISDAYPMDPIEIETMDMSAQGITSMEIYRNTLKDDGAEPNENRLTITDLASSLPFDLNFLLNFKNFSPTSGGDSVKIDTVLKKGIEINRIFDMRGYLLQSTDGDNDGDGWPDSAFKRFELDLDITIPEQKASIPLDGSPLGEFTMKMSLETLSFSSIGANLIMEMPSPAIEQEFPPGFTGVIPTEAQFNIIFKNQIQLPIEMLMQFKGYNSLGDLTYVPVIIDTLGLPATNSDLDTAVTIISLNKLGTTISIFDNVDLYNSYILDPSVTPPSFSRTNAPCDTCSSIIDLLASNPVQLQIIPEIKVDGRGSITANKVIKGAFEVKIPFILQIEPMAFLGGTATEIEAFDHQTRYKIRNSLLETSLVSTITNALPFGAEVSVLMSNKEFFPIDTSREQLNFYRDTLVSQGKLTLGDSLYILRKCTDISPDSGRVYIFNIMTDFSDCINGLPYIVKSNGNGTDTIFSYVDTLFKFLLPTPESYYGENDTTGYPEGMVAIPGMGTYPSTIDTSQIFLLTDYGKHYTMPRFYLPGTENKSVFLSSQDYLEISSFITFTLSSSGAFGSASNELLIISPNGTETFYDDEEMIIKWVALGNSEETVDLFYSTSIDSSTYKKSLDSCKQTDNWLLIESGLTSVPDTNSYTWSITENLVGNETLKIRLKAIYSNGEACDINGYYINIRNRSAVRNVSPFKKSNISMFLK